MKFDEVALPQWIKPDESHGEKGKLLYVYEGIAKRHSKRFIISIGLFILFPGLLLTASSFTTDITPFDVFMTVLISIPFFLVPGSFIFIGATSMPFCIYENGFSGKTVSFLEGLRNREHFINWSLVESIDLEQIYSEGSVQRRTLIRLKEKGEQYLPPENVLYQLKLLKEHIPEKLDSRFNRLVGSNPKLTPDPHVFLFKDKNPRIFVIFNLIMAFMAGIGSFSLFIVSLCAVVIIPVLFLYSSIPEISQRDYIRKISRPRQNEIAYPVVKSTRLLLDVRHSIRWNQVRTVHLALNTRNYYHESEVHLVSGERFRMPLSIYLAAQERPEFEQKGRCLHNTQTTQRMDPVIQWCNRKIVLFGAVNVLCFAAGAVIQLLQ